MSRRLQEALIAVGAMAGVLGVMYLALQSWWAAQDKTDPSIMLWGAAFYENLDVLFVSAGGLLVLVVGLAMITKR